MILLLPALC